MGVAKAKYNQKPHGKRTWLNEISIFHCCWLYSWRAVRFDGRNRPIKYAFFWCLPIIFFLTFFFPRFTLVTSTDRRGFRLWIERVCGAEWASSRICLCLTVVTTDEIVVNRKMCVAKVFPIEKLGKMFVCCCAWLHARCIYDYIKYLCHLKSFIVIRVKCLSMSV